MWKEDKKQFADKIQRLEDTEKMGSDKAALRHYFEHLLEWLTEGKIKTEPTLSATVLVGSVLFSPHLGKTLLEALGYDHTTMIAEYPVRLFRKVGAVDFCLGTEPGRWLLELKAPNVSCSDPLAVGQLRDYLLASRLPLGVLFNGKEARAFINTSHPQLKAYAQIEVSVLQANGIEMVTFLQHFTVEEMQNSLNVARKLARIYVADKKKETAEKERQKTLEAEVCRLLQSPPSPLLQALLDASQVLTHQKAAPAEIALILKSLHLPVPPLPVVSSLTTRRGLNPKIRALVAEFYQRTGSLDALLNIRGLRMRETEGQGYRPVKDRSDQTITCVQGVDREAAEEIIAALERLLTNLSTVASNPS